MIGWGGGLGCVPSGTSPMACVPVRMAWTMSDGMCSRGAQGSRLGREGGTSALVTTLEGAALLDVAKSVINHHAAGGLSTKGRGLREL